MSLPAHLTTATPEGIRSPDEEAELAAAGIQTDMAPKKVRFARGLRSGLSSTEALAQAGYTWTSDAIRRSLISRLLKDPDVQRIACPEPQGAAELAEHVWQMQLSMKPGVTRTSLLKLYAGLRGYLVTASANAKQRAAFADATDTDLDSESIDLPQQ